jgi:hypothetical protein
LPLPCLACLETQSAWFEHHAETVRLFQHFSPILLNLPILAVELGSADSDQLLLR